MKNILNKTNEKRTITILYAVIFMLSLFLGIYSISLFETGKHNIDLGQNLNKINVDVKPYGLSFVDTNSEGSSWTAKEMYIEGMEQSGHAFYLLGLSALLFGFSIKGLFRLE